MSDFGNRPQIEVLAAADSARRRHWSDEEKVRIVGESFVGHRQAAGTARRHGVCRPLLTIWRRQYRNGEFGKSRFAAFSAVSATRDGPAWKPGPVDPFEPARDARVGIALPNGRRLVVPAELDPEALVRLIQLVESA